MMRPVEYSTATPFMSAAIGLPAVQHYFLHCIDDHGRHVTRGGTDGEFWKMLISSPPSVFAHLEIPADKFPVGRLGWPDEWDQPAGVWASR